MITLPVIAAIAVDVDKTIIIQFLLFMIAMFGLHCIFGKKFLEVRQQRLASTEGFELEASQFETRAESMLLQYESMIKQAKQDAAQVRDACVIQGQEDSTELIEETREKLNRKLSQERSELETQLAEARLNIHNRVDELSNTLVSKVLHQ